MKGLYDNEMKLEFTSKTSNEAFARITVAAFASQLDPNIDELSDIKTAISEAVTNSIIHGYENEEGIVKIFARIFANTLEVEISDNGKGIENVEMAMKPLYTSKPNLERSGMGFTIMESFMDDIKVESAIGIGTRVIMKKKINSKDISNEMEA
jgi:stage II sporulation protein AB (anti-sigma F factor)